MIGSLVKAGARLFLGYLGGRGGGGCGCVSVAVYCQKHPKGPNMIQWDGMQVGFVNRKGLSICSPTQVQEQCFFG